MWWFLDDERFPPENGEDWVIYRTGEELLADLEANGWPKGISFDHDLGDTVISGHDTVNEMIDMIGNAIITNPTNVQFKVHSENRVGAVNIEKALPDLNKIKYGVYIGTDTYT